MIRFDNEILKTFAVPNYMRSGILLGVLGLITSALIYQQFLIAKYQGIAIQSEADKTEIVRKHAVEMQDQIKHYTAMQRRVDSIAIEAFTVLTKRRKK